MYMVASNSFGELSFWTQHLCYNKQKNQKCLLIFGAVFGFNSYFTRIWSMLPTHVKHDWKAVYVSKILPRRCSVFPKGARTLRRRQKLENSQTLTLQCLKASAVCFKIKYNGTTILTTLFIFMCKLKAAASPSCSRQSRHQSQALKFPEEYWDKTKIKQERWNMNQSHILNGCWNQT